MDSDNKPKTPDRIVVHSVGGAIARAPSLSASVNDRYRKKSWGETQLGTPVTWSVGGKSVQTDNVADIAKLQKSRDPRPVPSQIPDQQHIDSTYGGNILKKVPSKAEIHKRNAIQKANWEANAPLVPEHQGFGARTDNQIRMQKQRLRNWDQEQIQAGPLPPTDVRTWD